MTSNFRIKIFGDGADKEAIAKLNQNPLIAGFTTNPTLMRKAGVVDYKHFALEVLSIVKDKPISFEVLSDDFVEMESQAREIASWGDNVYVKIPITNTLKESSVPLIARLAALGVKLNVTAIMTIQQIEAVIPALRAASSAYVSVFAGRIADAGIDPEPTMRKALELMKEYPHIELLWASPREVFNVVQADKLGCHIITATDDVLKKLSSIGKDLEQFSLETVKMFYDDAVAAGYQIKAQTDFAPPAVQPVVMSPN